MSGADRAPLRAHIAALAEALGGVERHAGRIAAWGRHAAAVLLGGGRLLAAGNGGSAAEAQHLTAELVGRYQRDRVPLSAIALHAETSSVTALSNDYGPCEMFARQVRAHGRPGDLLVLLSTSGRSPNLLAAADAGRTQRLTVWGLTGPAPNPLAARCHDALCVDAAAAGTVQEVHLLVVHLLSEVIEARARALEHAEVAP